MVEVDSSSEKSHVFYDTFSLKCVMETMGVSNLPLPRSLSSLAKIVILITKPHLQNFLTGGISSIDIC